jgi:hypothetical protein
MKFKSKIRKEKERKAWQAKKLEPKVLAFSRKMLNLLPSFFWNGFWLNSCSFFLMD